MIRFQTGMMESANPPTIETTSLERGGSRRRVLFDESVARHAFGSDERPRAGVLRSPLEWAAAAVHFITGTASRRPPSSMSTDDVEIRNV
jgi:hypothetical protein